jgi:hypothetical protein
MDESMKIRRIRFDGDYAIFTIVAERTPFWPHNNNEHPAFDKFVLEKYNIILKGKVAYRAIDVGYNHVLAVFRVTMNADDFVVFKLQYA